MPAPADRLLTALEPLPFPARLRLTATTARDLARALAAQVAGEPLLTVERAGLPASPVVPSTDADGTYTALRGIVHAVRGSGVHAAVSLARALSDRLHVPSACTCRAQPAAGRRPRSAGAGRGRRAAGR